MGRSSRAAEGAAAGSARCDASVQRAHVFQGGGDPKDLHGGGVEGHGFQGQGSELAGGREDYHLRKEGRAARHHSSAKLPVRKSGRKHGMQRRSADGPAEQGGSRAGSEKSGASSTAESTRGDPRGGLQPRQWCGADGAAREVRLSEWEWGGRGSRVSLRRRDGAAAERCAVFSDAAEK